MIIYDVSGKKRVSFLDVKAMYPDTSFSKKPTSDALAPLGLVLVNETPRPEDDVVTEGQPEQRDDGKWYQTWEVREFTPEEKVKQFEQAKLSAKDRINRAYEDEMNSILSEYPQAETMTWDKQEREAREWQADNSVSTPYVDKIAEVRNMDKADLVQRIIEKADVWIELSGNATGKRQALEESIDAAETVDDANAIQWQ